MADRWWRTADGAMDPGHRDRARVLRAVAEQVIAEREPADVTNHPSSAVNALVASGSLRDLGNDRVAFRHDVLREWAIAQMICIGPDGLARLRLARPASAVLARAVELYARMLLERSSNAESWSALLNRLSQDGIHLSWRRSVLLAVVRSEIGSDLLTRASALLYAEKAKLLRELIRTVMAVDTQPAAKVLAGAGMDPAIIPPSLNVPSGPSWQRLILWLLSLGENVPPAAVPDVVTLYKAWSTGAFGVDPLTPVLLQWLYRWLTQIEAARHSGPGAELALFGGHLGYEQLHLLESELREGFLLFCYRTPALAVEYLQAQRRHHRRGDSVSSILRFRGTLAQVAPAELAELTATSLIPEPSQDEDQHYGRYELREPFDYLDHEFLPASPAQGPFLELLIHAPEHGLWLIQRLVEHAISFYSGGKQDPNPILIPGANGDRGFPWARSYAWSRQGPGQYSVTCARMALEAWGHRRIEAGEPIQQVLDDVLAPPGTPAAYLLVAVDLLISHWPSSREAVIPFLGCPELLCIDRDRATQDRFPQPDFLGLGALQREPQGLATGDSLNRRPSRRASLEQLIGHYGVFGPPELREELRKFLHRAVMRLGTPAPDADFSDPAMMAAHALNLCDPAHWREVPVQKPDGTQTNARQYVPPKAEARHLEGLQSAAAARFGDSNMQAAISLALEDLSHSSPEFAAAAATWAHGAEASIATGEKDEQWMRDQAVLAAAMIAMRDGTAELRSRERSWAEGAFARALQTPEDPAHRYRAGIRFNPPAIGFVGMVHSLKDGITPEQLRRLLEMAGLDDPAAAHGFGAAALALAAIDERLPRAVLRSALATVARPSRQWGNRPEREFTARLKSHRRQVEAAIDGEYAWLAGQSAEPAWPPFPPSRARTRRRGIVLGGDSQPPRRRRPTPPKEHADHQVAALWVGQAVILADMAQRPWLRDVARAYSDWTAAANGAGLDRGEEIADRLGEWNNAYFNLLACCLPGLTLGQIDEIALTSIGSLPDEAFFDVAAPFLRTVDVLFFNRNALTTEIVVHIRSQLARRVMITAGWRRLVGSPSASVERHIGPIIATLFFNAHGIMQPTRCYLREDAIGRLEPFLPILNELIEKGPSFFVALLTLNLFEVFPKPVHLPVIVAAAVTWLRAYPENVPFWADSDFGRRICGLIDTLRQASSASLTTESALRTEVDHVLASLVGIGVPEAARLERAVLDEDKVPT
jgi:hypothetical protein